MNYVQKLYINIFCTWSKKFVLMLFCEGSKFVENDRTHSITDWDSWRGHVIQLLVSQVYKII